MVSVIRTPNEFFRSVVDPDVKDFLNGDLQLRMAYHACNSLLSLRDWIVKTYGGQAWILNGATQPAFNGIEQLQQKLQSVDPAFAAIADIANASKHMVLDRGRTAMTGSHDTQRIQIGGPIGSGPIGAAPLGASVSDIVVNVGGHIHSVREQVKRAQAVWTRILDENGW